MDALCHNCIQDESGYCQRVGWAIFKQNIKKSIMAITFSCDQVHPPSQLSWAKDYMFSLFLCISFCASKGAVFHHPEMQWQEAYWKQTWGHLVHEVNGNKKIYWFHSWKKTFAVWCKVTRWLEEKEAWSEETEAEVKKAVVELESAIDFQSCSLSLNWLNRFKCCNPRLLIKREPINEFPRSAGHSIWFLVCIHISFHHIFLVNRNVSFATPPVSFFTIA